MQRSVQGLSARRFEISEFDVTLPDEARKELQKRLPVKPPLPVASARERLGWGTIGLLALLIPVAFGVVALAMVKPKPDPSVKAAIEKALTNAAASVSTPIHRTLNPWLLPAPTPTLTPIPSSTPREAIITVEPLPTLRAELVKHYRIPMPYGREVSGTFSGYVSTVDDLPAIGSPDEFYVAQDTGIAWVWTQWAQGCQGAWIDP